MNAGPRKHWHRLAICTIIGAIATLALAWAAALTTNEGDADARRTSGTADGHPWVVHVDEWFGVTRVRRMYAPTWSTFVFESTHGQPVPAIPWSAVHDGVPEAGEDGTMLQLGLEMAAGFPFRALWCEYVQEFNPVPLDAASGRRSKPTFRAVSGIVLEAQPNGRPRLLPVRPILAGFVANTLIFAVAIFIPWSVAGIVRSLHRRRRNRCPGCGYSLQGITGDVCPECGERERGESQIPAR